MAIVSRVLPSTAVFLDTAENPTQQIIRSELISGNSGLETFTLRSSLLSPPYVTLTQIANQLNIANPAILDYNDFILIYKSMVIAPYTIAQNYAFAASFEILNHQVISQVASTVFLELE